jgi:hypothetical protein
MYVTAFNTSSGPVTVDAEGRQIGSKDWGTIDTTADQAKAGVESGRLVIVDVAEDAHPHAAAAQQRTAQVAERFTHFESLDKEQLVAVAKDAGVPDADDAHKRDLAHALASRLHVALPDPPEPEPSTGESPPAEPDGQVPDEPQPEPTPETAPAESKPAKQTSRRAGRE